VSLLSRSNCFAGALKCLDEILSQCRDPALQHPPLQICSDSFGVTQGSEAEGNMETVLCSDLRCKVLQQLLCPHLRASRGLQSLPGAEPQPSFAAETQAWTKSISPSHLVTHSEALAAELKIHRALTRGRACGPAGESPCCVGAPVPARNTGWPRSRRGQGQHSHFGLLGCNISHLTRQLRGSREAKQPSSFPLKYTSAGSGSRDLTII